MATVKKAKKAQDGREVMFKQGNTYENIQKVNRPEGVRYYSAKSPNESTARTIVNFKKRSNPADSTRAVDVAKDAMNALNKQKNGGKTAKDGKWMQKAAASIKKRGTEGVCTGSKFGGPTCKSGSKRYNLAKTFKSVAKKKK